MNLAPVLIYFRQIMIQSTHLLNCVEQGKRKYSIVDGDLTNIKGECSSVVEHSSDKGKAEGSIPSTRICG